MFPPWYKYLLSLVCIGPSLVWAGLCGFLAWKLIRTEKRYWVGITAMVVSGIFLTGITWVGFHCWLTDSVPAQAVAALVGLWFFSVLGPLISTYQPKESSETSADDQSEGEGYYTCSFCLTKYASSAFRGAHAFAGLSGDYRCPCGNRGKLCKACRCLVETRYHHDYRETMYGVLRCRYCKAVECQKSRSLSTGESLRCGTWNSRKELKAANHRCKKCDADLSMARLRHRFLGSLVGFKNWCARKLTRR